MMRHVRAHDGGGPRGALRRTLRMQVESLVQAIGTQHAHLLQLFDVVHDGPGLMADCEKGCVRSDDKIVLQIALEPEPWDTERPILVGLLRIDAGVGRFGDAPRHSLRASVRDLRLDCERGALRDERSFAASHEERGHEVLKHRPAPREECRRAEHARHWPAQRVPMGLRHVAFYDRNVAGETRFRCQKIVDVHIDLVDRDIEPDVKEFAGVVEEQSEVHSPRASASAHAPRSESSA